MMMNRLFLVGNSRLPQEREAGRFKRYLVVMKEAAMTVLSGHLIVQGELGAVRER